MGIDHCEKEGCDNQRIKNQPYCSQHYHLLQTERYYYEEEHT